MPDTSLTPAPGPRRFPLGKWRRAHQKDDDRLTPLMKAIKAVHSATSSLQPTRKTWKSSAPGRSCSASWSPRRWACAPTRSRCATARCLFRLSGCGWTPGMTGTTPCCTATAAATPAASWAMRGCWPASWRWPPGSTCFRLSTRLSPEHPYPAAVQDALGAWDTLAYLGYGARDIFVAGDSAGGNLALELALRLKEQGRRQPRGLLLFSPWTDMTAAGAQLCGACRRRPAADP